LSSLLRRPTTKRHIDRDDNMRLGAAPSSATLVNLHIVRRVALSQANIWSSSIGLPRPSSTSSAKRPTRTRNNLLITSERLLKTRNRMIPNSAPLDSGGIRAADNGAHRRTRDRRRRNPHFVQRLRSQDVRNSTCAAASKRYSLAGDYLLSGPTTVHSACFFCYCELSRANQYHAGKNPPAI
jgi:hypothetical protein